MKIIMKILIYETDYENQGVYENLGLWKSDRDLKTMMLCAGLILKKKTPS